MLMRKTPLRRGRPLARVNKKSSIAKGILESVAKAAECGHGDRVR